ncbi:hypothetical protein GF407_02700 [candidate division KSB1 bacterium]|nr:hypothetical protein [candidate division KSB1 bacterium]
MNVSEPFQNHHLAVMSIFKRFALLPRTLRLKVFSWTHDEQKTRVRYIGEGESLDYLRNTVFKDHHFERKATIAPWQLKRYCRYDGITIIEINRFLKGLCRSQWITYPWIRQKVELGGEHYRARRRSIEDNYGRKARKYGYTFTCSREPEQVDIFYENYYLPYIYWRYGNLSHVRTKACLQNLLQQGKGLLFKVETSGVWVAAIFCVRNAAQLTILALGMAGDFKRHLHRGALSAGYYLLDKWAQENDFTVLDLLRSRPFVNDGVYNHKKKWGAQPCRDPWPHTCWTLLLPEDCAVPKALHPLLIWRHRRFLTLNELL